MAENFGAPPVMYYWYCPFSPEVSGYSRTKVQGCPHGSPYEAADSAVHRGDRGALIEGTPNCRLPASPNHPRGFSPRFYHSFREACGSSQRQPSCTSGLSCFLDRRRSAIQPLSGWLIGALVPTARLHSLKFDPSKNCIEYVSEPR